MIYDVVVNLKTPLKFKASSDRTWLKNLQIMLTFTTTLKTCLHLEISPLPLRRKGAPTLLNSHLFDRKRTTEGGYVLIQHHVFPSTETFNLKFHIT